MNHLPLLTRGSLPPNDRGSAFEQWMILQVLYLDLTERKRWKLSSYRSEGGAEVDLIIETPEAFVGLEIKASRNVGPSDLKGLKSLKDLAPKNKTCHFLVAYLGVDNQIFTDGIKVMPATAVLDWLDSTL